MAFFRTPNHHFPPFLQPLLYRVKYPSLAYAVLPHPKLSFPAFLATSTLQGEVSKYGWWRFSAPQIIISRSSCNCYLTKWSRILLNVLECFGISWNILEYFGIIRNILNNSNTSPLQTSLAPLHPPKYAGFQLDGTLDTYNWLIPNIVHPKWSPMHPQCI